MTERRHTPPINQARVAAFTLDAPSEGFSPAPLQADKIAASNHRLGGELMGIIISSLEVAKESLTTQRVLPETAIEIHDGSLATALSQAKTVLAGNDNLQLGARVRFANFLNEQPDSPLTQGVRDIFEQAKAELLQEAPTQQS